MKIHLLAVGKHMPDWVVKGYQEYAKRFPAHCQLVLQEISAAKRSKNSDINKLMQQEADELLTAIPAHSHVIALEVGGRNYSTLELAKQLETWQTLGQPISLLVGGPDGLADKCRHRAQQLWSLSSLTLPHPLVRVIVAEQLYRALTILQGHPYHR